MSGPNSRSRTLVTSCGSLGFHQHCMPHMALWRCSRSTRLHLEGHAKGASTQNQRGHHPPSIQQPDQHHNLAGGPMPWLPSI